LKNKKGGGKMKMKNPRKNQKEEGE